MKRLFSIFLFILILFTFPSCRDKGTNLSSQGTKIVDAFGNTAYIKKDSRIVVCYGSFAHCLLLSGLSPIGVTSDATEEHNLIFPSETEIVGSVKEINLESVFSLDPDYVIMSADLSAHIRLEDAFKNAHIPYGYFRIDTFSDYKSFMETLCLVSGREDLFLENVLKTEENINAVKSKISPQDDKTVLLMRAFGSGIKAKGQDNLAGQILNEFGLLNVSDNHPSLLEDLSKEQIIHLNPDYIFVLTMGNEETALAYLENNIENNTAFENLNAVTLGHYIVLPKDLFHYKPNNRWDEAYEYLAKIICPESF